jgi:hypothetical protein
MDFKCGLVPGSGGDLLATSEASFAQLSASLRGFLRPDPEWDICQTILVGGHPSLSALFSVRHDTVGAPSFRVFCERVGSTLSALDM